MTAPAYPTIAEDEIQLCPSCNGPIDYQTGECRCSD